MQHTWSTCSSNCTPTPPTSIPCCAGYGGCDCFKRWWRPIGKFSLTLAWKHLLSWPFQDNFWFIVSFRWSLSSACATEPSTSSSIAKKLQSSREFLSADQSMNPFLSSSLYSCICGLYSPHDVLMLCIKEGTCEWLDCVFSKEDGSCWSWHCKSLCVCLGVCVCVLMVIL